MSRKRPSARVGRGWLSLGRIPALAALLCLGASVLGAGPAPLESASPEPAALVLTGIAAEPVTVELSAVAPSTAEPATLEAKRPFRHARHVSVLWPGSKTSPVEVARDCRGCHDYSHPDPSDDRKPTDTCTDCHILDVLKVEIAEARVDPAREVDRAFQHHEHLQDRDGKTILCASCHTSPEAQAGRRARRDDPPIIVPEPSFAFCAGCHENQGDRDGFNSGLTRDTKERMARSDGKREPRRFRHEQHLSPAEIAKPTAALCERCHADVPRADARHLAENQIHLDRCEECHRGMDFEIGHFQKKSASAATFVHAYHVGGAGAGSAEMAGARAKIDQQGCLACHAWSSDEKTFVVADFLSRKGLGQEGCVTCHTTWKVERHGESDSCSRCHTIQEGGFTDLAAQASNRPRVPVLRADPSAFRIEEQAHLFVHTSAEPTGECARCHVASIDRAPSQIGEKPFRHDLHLPADFGQRAAKDAEISACTSCHASISESVASDGIVGTRYESKAADAGPHDATFHFDRASCDRCHGAPAFSPVVPEPVHARDTLAFDHKRHLNRKHPNDPSRSMVCVDCHRLDRGNGDYAIVIDEKVQNCTLCHGHDEKHAAVTGKLDEQDVRACTSCHAPGVPRQGQAVEVARARIQEVRGAQVHSGDEACSTCHRLPAGIDQGGGRAEVDPAISGTIQAGPNPHAVASRDVKSKPFFQDQVACLDCHFGNMEKPLSQTLAQFRDQAAEWAGERARKAAKLAQEDRWRAEFGAQLQGYPGLGSR